MVSGNIVIINFISFIHYSNGSLTYKDLFLHWVRIPKGDEVQLLYPFLFHSFLLTLPRWWLHFSFKLLHNIDFGSLIFLSNIFLHSSTQSLLYSVSNHWLFFLCTRHKIYLFQRKIIGEQVPISEYSLLIVYY